MEGDKNRLHKYPLLKKLINTKGTGVTGEMRYRYSDSLLLLNQELYLRRSDDFLEFPLSKIFPAIEIFFFSDLSFQLEIRLYE